MRGTEQVEEQRWTMAKLYRIIDILAVNAYILYNSYKNNPPLKRNDFIKKLAKSHVKPHRETRIRNLEYQKKYKY